MSEAEESAGKSSMEAAEAAFEQEMVRAMRRVDAPKGFAARVFELGMRERAAKEGAAHTASAEGVPVRSPDPSPSRARVLRMPRRQSMVWASGALAAMLVAGVFVGQHERLQHEKRVTAERQFETATRITDETLEHTREQLQKQGIDLDGQQ